MNEVLRYADTIVMTTKQLAEAYGCSTRQLKQNFNNNKEHFVDGKHFFRLEGEALRTFKSMVEDIDHAAARLILWTKRGAARHSKMLGTERAWNVFDELEENYFNPTYGLTPAELLLYNAKQLVEHERAIRAVNTKLASVDGRLTMVESKQLTIDKHYYTVIGYANLHGLPSINRNKAAVLGRKAAKISHEQGYEIGKEYDAKYGHVNTYHEQVLDIVFGGTC